MYDIIVILTTDNCLNINSNNRKETRSHMRRNLLTPLLSARWFADIVGRTPVDDFHRLQF